MQPAMMSSSPLWSTAAGELWASRINLESHGRHSFANSAMSPLLDGPSHGSVDRDLVTWAPTATHTRWKWLGHAVIIGMAALGWWGVGLLPAHVAPPPGAAQAGFADLSAEPYDVAPVPAARTTLV